jgi:hypothetical protein
MPFPSKDWIFEKLSTTEGFPIPADCLDDHDFTRKRKMS